MGDCDWDDPRHRDAGTLDIWTAKKRSEVMAKVRWRGNASTELALAKELRRNGVIGWRRHSPIRIDSRLVRPDFVFRQSKVVVFVDGCFWHQCPQHATMPSSRRSFWEAKLQANKARDRRDSRALRKLGWKVVRIWEHSVRRESDRCIRRIVALIETQRRRR